MSSYADLPLIGTAFMNAVGRLYPVVGIGGLGVEVTVNFGPNNFLCKDLP